ncbi:MAG: hypothetical protein NTW16_05645 [Bacteroidetes bacterium]|nr:hypothetical protein [Bacteroidota bacterium]
MAIFAISFSSAYGQVTCPAPRVVDVTCLPSSALSPMPGTPYTYEVNVPTPPGVQSYTWFVTQDKNFISGGALTSNRELVGVHMSAAGVGYNNPPASNTLSITWKSFVYDAANPVFVVIEVKPTTGCTSANNLKVFKIMPVNAFTLDIANVGANKQTVSAYETSIDRCISKVMSSTYDPLDDQIKMDFGADTLYYVVTAANFSTSWRPSLMVTAINALETVTSVQWFRPTDALFATPEAMPINAGLEYVATNPVVVLDPSGSVGPTGECIVIRVIVDHTNGVKMYEGLGDETITVAVDGKTQLALATPLGDIHFSKTVGIAADCGVEDAYRNDISTQILKGRSDIQPVTPPAFLPIKP